MKSVRLLFALVGLLLLLGLFDQFANKASEQKTKKDIAKESPKPTISTSPSPSPVNNFFEETPEITNLADNSYVYPNSRVLSSTDNNFELQTNDDPEIVTNWYKEKVNSQEFSARSAVSTKTNGNVLNKISAKGLIKIEVEIRKALDASHTTISVKF